MIGRIVSDRYEVMKYLGGGMSSVYLARDIILDREVVVKLIKVDHHNREKSKARFQREVESTIHLAHPNIVSVLDVDESEEYHLLVTEVVHGPTLKEFIRDNHPVPGSHKNHRSSCRREEEEPAEEPIEEEEQIPYE